MEKDLKQNLIEIFNSLSESAQRLLISMAIAGKQGMKRDAISAVSGLDDSALETAIAELVGQKLLEQGQTIDEEFIVDEGQRFRLPIGISEKVKSDILKTEE